MPPLTQIPGSAAGTAGPTVVERLRAKRTLYAAWSAHAVFAAANAWPRWETLVPASALVGVTMASVNIVYGLYVTTLADQLTAAAAAADRGRFSLNQSISQTRHV